VWLLFIAAIAVCTAAMVDSFRDRVLADIERELKNTALILAEQIDRSFQAIDSVVVKVRSLEFLQATASHARCPARQ
jgi:hypothetical protein